MRMCKMTRQVAIEVKGFTYIGLDSLGLCVNGRELSLTEKKELTDTEFNAIISSDNWYVKFTNTSIDVNNLECDRILASGDRDEVELFSTQYRRWLRLQPHRDALQSSPLAEA